MSARCPPPPLLPPPSSFWDSPASLPPRTAQRAVSYVGGHEPGRLVRIERAPEVVAPYALTGYQSSMYASQKTTRTELIWVGQRIVGVRVVGQ